MTQIEQLTLTVGIVDRGKGENMTAIARELGVRRATILLGLGTANSEILDYLGLGETEKDVVLMGIPEALRERLLAVVTERMQLDQPGDGILFCVPMTAIGGLRAMGMLMGDKEGTR